MRVAVLTVSDRAARGEYVDEAGPVVAGYFDDVAATDVVPDERDLIEDRLRAWVGTVDLIVITGGTGLGPRDVTPEATRAVIEREAPGLAEAMRAAGPPQAALSRQVCGIASTTLIVNVPGSPKAAAECLDAIIEILPHAVEMMKQ